MNKTDNAIKELNSINDLTLVKSFVRYLHPLAKLILTILYLLCVVSRNKYDLGGTIIMVIYPIIIYHLSNIKIKTCFYKLRYVLPLVMMVGIFNPLLDKTTIQSLYGINGGIISFVTLMLKGVYCLMASFILVATTPIEELCYALRLLHIPSFITSLLLLTYRYVGVLLEEVSVMSIAYKLRAPNQKGIHISVWGTFLGQLILRTMDRAGALYESMELRGFKGEFYYISDSYNKKRSIYFVFVMLILFILLISYEFIGFLIIEVFG